MSWTAIVRDRLRRREGARATARWAVGSRVLAAALAGYGCAAAASAVLARAWPEGRVEAVLGATMLSFVLCCCLMLWAFHCRSRVRLWTVLGGGALLLITIEWFLRHGGAG